MRQHLIADPTAPHAQTGLQAQRGRDSIVAHTSVGRIRAIANPNDPLVTRNDAAGYLNVSLRQVDRLIADGSLPALRVGERSIRIRRSALDALLVPVVSGGPDGRPAA